MVGQEIRLDEVFVRFGHAATPALDRVSARFSPGTVTAVIGGDGAGKSVLLRVLAGLDRCSGGTVGLPVSRDRLGYQPADSGVWRSLSVEENIEFVANAYGMSPAQTRKRSAELLELAGLAGARSRIAGRLSGGMRQKLGVVLATLHEPDLVLLDEPTTGVDPVSRAELWTLIAAAAAGHATVVVATAYLDEAERAGSVLLLGGGHVLAEGSPAAVVAETPGRVVRRHIGPDEPAERSYLPPDAHEWRRGVWQYTWLPASGDPAPPDTMPAPADLETTSIVRLLESEHGEDAAARILAEARAGAGSAGSAIAPVAPVTPVAPDSSDAPSAPGASNIDANIQANIHANRAQEQHLPEHGHAPLVEAFEVSRRYGEFTALDDVSITVSPGEVVGLLGGNGAGKTTLMRILLGLESPSSGSAALFDESPSLDARRRIGYVAQGLGLYPALSALENLEFAASVHGVRVPAPARNFARITGSTPVADLPLGTRRILAFLAATGHSPELLVLDEPTSGMDALTRARLWAGLRALADAGTGILVTTHYMEEASQCDRLVLLAAGVVEARGTVEEITGGVSSAVVASSQWERAFAGFRAAGLPVLLDGRRLRLPGVAVARAEAVLRELGIEAESSVEAQPATLGETMLLTDRRAARRG